MLPRCLLNHNILIKWQKRGYNSKDMAIPMCDVAMATGTWQYAI